MTVALAWVLAALAPASGGCGGRTVGLTLDGGPTPDGGPPPDAGPGPDGGPGPDAGPQGWQVPTEPVIVFNETEPGFVMSLDRMAEPGYVLGGASGWQRPQAGLWLLDGDTLAPRHEQRLDAEMVWARYDRWADQVVAVPQKTSRQRPCLASPPSFSLRLRPLEVQYNQVNTFRSSA